MRRELPFLSQIWLITRRSEVRILPPLCTVSRCLNYCPGLRPGAVSFGGRLPPVAPSARRIARQSGCTVRAWPRRRGWHGPGRRLPARSLPDLPLCPLPAPAARPVRSEVSPAADSASASLRLTAAFAASPMARSISSSTSRPAPASTSRISPFSRSPSRRLPLTASAAISIARAMISSERSKMCAKRSRTIACSASSRTRPEWGQSS